MLAPLKDVIVHLSLANVVDPRRSLHSFVIDCLVHVLQNVVFIPFIKLVLLILLGHIDRPVKRFHYFLRRFLFTYLRALSSLNGQLIAVAEEVLNAIAMLLNALNHFSLGCLRDSSHDLS